MKNFLSTHLPTATSLAGIARDMLAETHNAASTKVSDLRSQVEDLWQLAGEALPRKKTADMVRHVKRTYEALRNRDLISFPRLES
ncbi:MAG: hypothetical protein ACOYMS_00740 [Terrimicrobiaceae bacterium]